MSEAVSSRMAQFKKDSQTADKNTQKLPKATQKSSRLIPYRNIYISLNEKKSLSLNTYILLKRFFGK